MEELIKKGDKWVDPSVWLKERIEHYRKEEAREDYEANVTEEKGCKTYKEIIDAFEGDEVIEVNELSREWQDRAVLKEDLGHLRVLLGWPLYQEWLRETITG